VQVLFGINYVVSKVVIGVFPPLVWASLRIAIATLVMLVATLALKRPHPTDGRAFFIPLIGFALLGAVINQSAFLVGLKHTTSTNSAILNTLIPVFTLLVVTARRQEPLTWARAVGFVLALTGVLVIRNVEHLTISDDTLLGDLLTMVNCISYALFLSYSKKFMEAHDSLWTTTWIFAYGTVGLTVLALPDWAAFQWPAMSPGLWAAAIFAVLGATLLTYFLNFWALAHAKSSQVALYIYIQPVVAAALAWAWQGEIPTARTAAASVLIFLGMLLASGWISKHLLSRAPAR